MRRPAIPALTLLLGLPMATAVAISLLVIVINSAAGFTAHLGDATINIGIAAAFTAAAVLASSPPDVSPLGFPADGSADGSPTSSWLSPPTSSPRPSSTQAPSAKC